MELFRPVLAGLLFATAAWAGSPHRAELSFSITTNAGFGNEVFVVGNHADVGTWSPLRGAKLTWTVGNVWTGRVAVEAGVSLDYKFLSAPNSVTGFCDAANWGYIPPGSGNHFTTNVPVVPAAPYTGKTLYYHSSWTNAFLLYASNNSTNFTDVPMERVGAGRFAGEYLYKVSGFGEAGKPVQFVPHGWLAGVEDYDNAPYAGYGGGDYYTSLDVFFLQDGDVFNYRPPVSLSAPRLILSNAVSTHSPSPSRTMKVYLPRGYDENTWKRYPVVYMHDGENVFFPGGENGSWDADLIATKETSQGRMREAIIVSLNSTASRQQEYLPPEDNEGGDGFGDTYCRFLVDDVKAKIDAEFRTLPGRVDTMTIGASMGGLISTYLGWSTNVFGGIGAFSSAYLVSPNFNARVAAGPKQDFRIYTDMGTDGYPEDILVADHWVVLDYLLRDGWVPNADLLHDLACGAFHNEAAWAARLPACFRFLLDVTAEPGWLAQAEHPPRLVDAVGQGGSLTGRVETLAGWQYRLETASTVTSQTWSGLSTVAVETLPWSSRSFAAQAPSNAQTGVFRATPAVP